MISSQPPIDQMAAMRLTNDPSHYPQLPDTSPKLPPSYQSQFGYHQSQHDNYPTQPPNPTSVYSSQSPPMPPAPYTNYQASPNVPANAYHQFPPTAPPAPPNVGQPDMHSQYPNQPGYVNGPPQPKASSSQNLPSVVEVIESNRASCQGSFGTGQRGVAPPLVTTDFVCRDEGNCNPRFIRSSLYAVPTTSDLLKSVGLPLSITLTPFASLHRDEQPIVLGDMGSMGPVRCTRCRAYMNPFMGFIDGGRRFHCPLCDSDSEVPNEYFAHLDHTGRRTDTYHRPELCLGSYDLTATVEYCTNNEPPSAPAFIFLLDVSQSSLRSGLVDLFCSQFIDRILPKLPRDEFDSDPDAPSPLRIGFITYDSQIQFYSSNIVRRTTAVNNGSSDPSCNGDQTATFSVKPQVHVVADVNDVFVPTVDGFLIEPDPALIQPLLQSIPSQFANASGSSTDAVLASAVQAGLEALSAAKRPGKLFVLHANLPQSNEANGKLVNREDRKLVGTDKEKTLLTPANNFYTTLGQSCVKVGCSVDMFLFPTAFVDLATIGEIPRLTGGNIFKYNCFQADLQGFQFLSDLETAVGQVKAFNAVMRVRTSPGIRPVEFFGNMHLPNTTDMEIAGIGLDQAFTVELRHEDKLPDNDAVYIQAACLYTSLSGQRRLRIHNLTLLTTSHMAEVFRLVDLDTHINWMAKHAVRSLLTRHYPHLTEELNSRTANTLAAYRRQCASNPHDGGGGNPGELILPQNAKLYPLYVQCLIKSDAYQPADSLSIDDKVLHMFSVAAMDVKQSCIYFYSRLYPVHDLELTSEGSIVYPPKAIRCSFDWISQDGAYLLDNGFNLILWLGSNLSAEWLQNVLNAPSSKHFAPEKIYDLVKYDNTTSRNLCNLLEKIRDEHRRFTRLLVVRAGDPGESAFRRYLVEDRFSGNSNSYLEYLCHIHKEVTNLIR